MISAEEDERWMGEALAEAVRAAEEGEVPIGAVAVGEGGILARDHNRSIQLRDPTAHAEVLVLREAARVLGNYRLPGMRIYVTVEPCPMCAGALVWARVAELVYGTSDPKGGGVESRFRILEPGSLNHNVAVRSGVLEEPCRRVLQDFFSLRRKPAGSLQDQAAGPPGEVPSG
jgi:tRNA(adenine34) deaminase